MKYTNKIYRKFSSNYRLIAVAISVLSFTMLHGNAQENTVSSGGNASGTGGSVSYSVGQVFYQTHNGEGGTMTEGVQQPYEISVVTTIEEAIGINLSVKAYPNPTTDYLTLSIEDNLMTSHSPMYYQLYDMQGKLLQNEKITSSHTKVFMSNLVPATYFVRVIQGNIEVKTFKIIKN